MGGCLFLSQCLRKLVQGSAGSVSSACTMVLPVPAACPTSCACLAPGIGLSLRSPQQERGWWPLGAGSSAYNPSTPCPLLPSGNAELGKGQHHWVQLLAGTGLGWVAGGWWPGWVASYLGGRDGAELGDRRLVAFFWQGSHPAQAAAHQDGHSATSQQDSAQPFFCSGGVWRALGSKHWCSCLLSVHLSSCV